MCLKVYAFFNMEIDGDGTLYLRSQRSHFYQATNAQTKTLREFGVEQNILTMSDLYQPLMNEQTANNKDDDQRDTEKDVEVVEIDSDNGGEPKKLKTQARKNSQNRSMQTKNPTASQPPQRKAHRKKKSQNKRI